MASQFITVVDSADVAVATYRKVIEVEDYNLFSLHSRLISDDADNTVTMTLWASNDPDADDTADTGRYDISTAVLGGASLSANNATTENLDFVSTLMPTKYMVKYVVANTGALGNGVHIRANLGRST